MSGAACNSEENRGGVENSSTASQPEASDPQFRADLLHPPANVKPEEQAEAEAVPEKSDAASDCSSSSDVIFVCEIPGRRIRNAAAAAKASFVAYAKRGNRGSGSSRSRRGRKGGKKAAPQLSAAVSADTATADVQPSWAAVSADTATAKRKRKSSVSEPSAADVTTPRPAPACVSAESSVPCLEGEAREPCQPHAACEVFVADDGLEVSFPRQVSPSLSAGSENPGRREAVLVVLRGRVGGGWVLRFWRTVFAARFVVASYGTRRRSRSAFIPFAKFVSTNSCRPRATEKRSVPSAFPTLAKQSVRFWLAGP